MAKKEETKKPIYKKWWFWVIILLVLLFSTAANFSKDEPEPDKSSDSQVLLDKCTVMEAADLYTTGSLSDENVFDEAAKTCSTWLIDDHDGYEEAINTDWETRKSEIIEGKTLEQMLETYTNNDNRAKI